MKKQKSKNSITEKYCNHLESGFTPESFEDEDYKVLELSENDNEKNTIRAESIKRAKRAGRKRLENAALKELLGEGQKFNSGLWIFYMKNCFGWKEKKESGNELPFERPLKIKLGLDNENEEK